MGSAWILVSRMERASERREKKEAIFVNGGKKGEIRCEVARNVEIIRSNVHLRENSRVNKGERDTRSRCNVPMVKLN